MEFVRHCPRCGIDYRSDIIYCSDCGGELETRQEETDRRFDPPPSANHPIPTPDIPPGEYRSIYYNYDIAHLRPLAEALSQRGVPFRIDITSIERTGTWSASRFDLCIRDQDRRAAGEELARLPHMGVPAESFESVDRDFDPDRGYHRCPACGTDIPSHRAECPDCGLTLRSEPEPMTCSRCNRPVSQEDERCPSCGEPLED